MIWWNKHFILCKKGGGCERSFYNTQFTSVKLGMNKKCIKQVLNDNSDTINGGMNHVEKTQLNELILEVTKKKISMLLSSR